MGGGPASADVVRASCILTFPEETMVEPVPIDAWYLHAVGLTFLRRLARDRVGDELKIALLMQRIDDETQQKRYISVNSDGILRHALKETFDEPERVLVLHLISLDKVAGQRSIHVTPEINPNVSPEPVEPLGMVFPTLTVESVQQVPEAMAMSSSFRLSQSSYAVDKLGRSSFVGSSEKQLSHSAVFPAEDQAYGFTGTNKAPSAHSLPSATSLSVPSQAIQEEEEDEEGETSFAFSAAGAKLLGDHADENDIPFARVVHHAEDSTAVQIPSDYVMLDLQNGAGLGDTPTVPALGASTFFISPTWHLQADEVPTVMATRQQTHVPRQTTRSSGVWGSATTRDNATTNSNSSMEESFVMLERDLTPK